MQLAGRKVLVTGAGGFLGSHLVEALVREGCTVRALVRYRSDQNPGHLASLPVEVVQSVETVWGDLSDRGLLAEHLRGIDVVFHLAALVGVPFSYHAPSSYVTVNIAGTLNVLQAARQAGVARFIHASSAEVYGSAQYSPIDEKHPQVAQSPFAASKIAADQLAESFRRTYDLPVVTIRPFNTYGPRQSDRAVIPAIIAQRLADIDPVMIGQADAVRDLTYVTDTASAFVRAAACDEAVGRTFNIGSGKGITIGELARVIFALTAGGSYRVDLGRLRPPHSEVRELLCNATLAADVLGWRPTITLKQGLLATIEYVRAHPEQYRPSHYVI